MEPICKLIDRWFTAWIKWRRRKEPERYYITLQSDDALLIRDVKGRVEAVLKRDGTFVLSNYTIGIKTTLKSDPCEKK